MAETVQADLLVTWHAFPTAHGLWCWGRCGWGSPRGESHPSWRLRQRGQVGRCPPRRRAAGKWGPPEARSFLECGCWEGGTRSCGSHVVTMRGIGSGTVERPGSSVSAPGFGADPASGPGWAERSSCFSSCSVDILHPRADGLVRNQHRPVCLLT